MYVCLCRALAESTVRDLGCRGIIDAEEIVQELGLDDPRCCGLCRRDIEDFVALAKDGLEVARRGPVSATVDSI
jgi:bacterioferritin-associated ferredoxin